MAVEILEVAPGQWAYRVGGAYQEWPPEKAGFVPMTQAEAEFCAMSVSERLSA